MKQQLLLMAAALAMCGIVVWALSLQPEPDERVGVPPVAESGDDRLADLDLGPSTARPGAGAEPEVAWVDGGAYLAVTAPGSSSCPVGPQRVEAEGQQLTVTLGPLYPGERDCTADLGPHVTVVEVPAGLDPDRPVTVLLDGARRTLPPV
ncbi:hypothetical protein GB931_00510 [Modestobacter sp. I12A-02628]|uniref:Uncharacterized protein n=1 Tax=Goekera deserti TaxID=2497753 RepID=A0A7K3WHX4_9ACTN|nr:hypothetical protein [Goekera deserti]MPQ96429.1 hypothetical protein [Goekera deserti]NDI47258.1 hypothetical protein [Goekera deserti]NEL56088.1 hypothetical protein [Goekera deserti]